VSLSLSYFEGEEEGEEREEGRRRRRRVEGTD